MKKGKNKVFLETPRVRLCYPEEGDIEVIQELCSDPNVMRYIGNGKTRSLEETQKFFALNNNHIKQFGHGLMTVRHKQTEEFVGRAGIFHLAFQFDHPEIEMGYILSPKFWGQGYATEIATYLVEWAKENLTVPYLLGVTYQENTASQKVLKKVGMEFFREDIYPKTTHKSLFFKLDLHPSVC